MPFLSFEIWRSKIEHWLWIIARSLLRNHNPRKCDLSTSCGQSKLDNSFQKRNFVSSTIPSWQDDDEEVSKEEQIFSVGILDRHQIGLPQAYIIIRFVQSIFIEKLTNSIPTKLIYLCHNTLNNIIPNILTNVGEIIFMSYEDTPTYYLNENAQLRFWINDGEKHSPLIYLTKHTLTRWKSKIFRRSFLTLPFSNS